MKCIIYLFWASAGHDEINMNVSVKKQNKKWEQERYGRERESKDQVREQQNKSKNSKYDIHVS